MIQVELRGMYGIKKESTAWCIVACVRDFGLKCKASVKIFQGGGVQRER